MRTALKLTTGRLERIGTTLRSNHAGEEAPLAVDGECLVGVSRWGFSGRGMVIAATARIPTRRIQVFALLLDGELRRLEHVETVHHLDAVHTFASLRVAARAVYAHMGAQAHVGGELYPFAPAERAAGVARAVVNEAVKPPDDRGQPAPAERPVEQGAGHCGRLIAIS